MGTDQRTRMGLIVPSTNTVAETDFWRAAPEGMSVHTSRMLIQDTTAEDEKRMIEESLPGAARDLATCRPDVVVFSCTSAAAVIGTAGESKMVSELEKTCGARIVSTNAAVSKQIAKRGMGRVAVVTPYIEELTRKIVEGLNFNRIEAPQTFSMGIVDPFAIADVTSDEIIDFTVNQIDPGKVDGIFLSCTNMRGMEVRERIQTLTGLPVVTSNQAAFDTAVELING